MSFGDRLIKVRKNHGYTRESLAKELGISKFTLRNYELEATEPGHTFLKQISDFFNVSVDYLMELTEEQERMTSYDLKLSEYKHIEKYRSLDPYGQETVSYILDREVNRMQQIKEASESYEKSNIRYVQLYPRLASAGTGQLLFDDMPVDKIGIPDISEYKKVTYAIGVNGNSMEPLYHDGDMLLIEPTCKVDVGEIGIFIIGNESFVKKLGEGELISLNAGYGNIPLTEDSKCMGRVIDKISDHPELSDEDMNALHQGMLATKAQKKKA